LPSLPFKTQLLKFLEFTGLKTYSDKKLIIILFLGFASGLPLVLLLSTLSIWLMEVGVNKTNIGLFALSTTPYTIKFLWAPIIDSIKLPILDQILGRRRSWIIFSQILLIFSIVLLASSDPGVNIKFTVICTIIVAFASATQDIVIDAYRIESVSSEKQAAAAAMSVCGYRLGMLFSGAGALIIANYYSWQNVYVIMALAIIPVSIITLFAPDPKNTKAQIKDKDYLSWCKNHLIAPFKNFISNDKWLIILVFIMIYKLGDAFAGIMTNPFLIELGFTKSEIAIIVKSFGLAATLFGAFFGGLLASKYSIIKSLLIAGVLQLLTNFIFCIQALIGHNNLFLAVTIGAENFAGGMGTIIFIAYISRLCHINYTATQYALLSSFAAFSRTWFSASSGWFADKLDWVNFFIFSAILAIPGILMLIILSKSHANWNTKRN
jgi:MFS transporter, PAT family, beta-lactamase induction signal transducer AmpG